MAEAMNCLGCAAIPWKLRSFTSLSRAGVVFGRDAHRPAHRIGAHDKTRGCRSAKASGRGNGLGGGAEAARRPLRVPHLHQEVVHGRAQVLGLVAELIEGVDHAVRGLIGLLGDL